MSNKKMSIKYLMIISRNLGQIYKDGIPINEGIDLIGETIHNKDYKQSLQKISLYMKEGLNLSDSFMKFHNLYPNSIIFILHFLLGSFQLVKTQESFMKYFGE